MSDPGAGSDAMTRVYLGVETASVDAEELSRRVPIEPTATSAWRSPQTGLVYSRTEFDLGSGPIAYLVVEEAGQRLLAFGRAVAEGFGWLAKQPDTTVYLMIVQQVTDEARTKGLKFEPDVVQWLDRAGASIVIDQYVGG